MIGGPVNLGEGVRKVAQGISALHATAEVLTHFLLSSPVRCPLSALRGPPYTSPRPALAGFRVITSRIRAMAKGKRTYQPNNRRRARRHGFRLRMRTRAGRAIVSARRRKGRRRLTA